MYVDIYLVAFSSDEEDIVESYDIIFHDFNHAKKFAEDKAREKGFNMDECSWSYETFEEPDDDIDTLTFENNNPKNAIERSKIMQLINVTIYPWLIQE